MAVNCFSHVSIGQEDHSQRIILSAPEQVLSTKPATRVQEAPLDQRTPISSFNSHSLAWTSPSLTSATSDAQKSTQPHGQEYLHGGIAQRSAQPHGQEYQHGGIAQRSPQPHGQEYLHGGIKTRLEQTSMSTSSAHTGNLCS